MSDPPREPLKVRSLRDELGFLLDSTVDLPATAYDRDTLVMRIESAFLAREKSPPPSVSDASRASRLVERWINRGVDWPATFYDVAKMKGELATAFNDASAAARRTIAELEAERDAANEKWWKVRAFRQEIAPEICGGTDFWDAHTPREIGNEARRLRDNTIEAIVSIVRERAAAAEAENARLRRLLENRGTE